MKLSLVANAPCDGSGPLLAISRLRGKADECEIRLRGKLSAKLEPVIIANAVELTLYVAIHGRGIGTNKKRLMAEQRFLQVSSRWEDS